MKPNKTSITLKKSLKLLFILLISNNFRAQCPVTAYASPQTVVCGNTVNLTAVAAGCKPLNNNFNGGDMTMGGTQPWSSTVGANVENGTGTYACVGPPAEGAYSVWMGTTVAAPRSITTNNYDMTQCAATSATLCFDMKYGTQGGASPCEGIDLPAEGVSIQYNTGSGWVTLQYWDPNGGYDPSLTSWNRYCISLPPAAMTSATQFRWYQDQSSGAGFDAWGLDNMVLNLNTPGYTFDWAHDAQAPQSSPTTPAVNPTSNTTYTVTYTNGVETCSSPVTVTVIKPTATALVTPSAICSGGSVQLNAQSSINMPPPSSCGVNSTAACTPFSTIADERQVGAGATTHTYNNVNEDVFGDYGDAYMTTQILFKASELTAAGIVAGQINNMSFDIEKIVTNPTAASSVVYPNMKISIGCTNLNVMTATYISGLSQVYSGTNVNLSVGWQPFFFSNSYNWDGVSNIIVQVCFYWVNGASSQDAPPNGTNNYYAYLRYNSPGYNCSVNVDNSNFSIGSCSTDPTFATVYNYRPNVKFGFCKPNNAPLTYAWSSSPAGFTSAAKNPTASPVVNTSYTVLVNQTGMPAGCAASSTVPVTIVSPTVSVTPNPAEICAPATSINLVATASTNTSVTGTVPFTNSTSGAVADGGCTALTRTITVSGASPNTIGANPVLLVNLNITAANDGDIKVILKDPAGNAVTLINNGTLSGANLTNTRFTPTAVTAITSGAAPYSAGPYIPNSSLTGFPSGDAVNGTWTLEIYDCSKPVLSSSVSTFNSWSISFLATNAIASYSWAPPTNLSSTTTANTTSSTTVNRTYTLTVTDYLGCTASVNVPVNIGCALPVELTDFNLNCNNDEIDIKWDIASQLNNDFFTLEKSFDGINYSQIAIIDGDMNSNSNKTYSFMDKNENKSISNHYPIYYKLFQTDLDGKRNMIANKMISNCQSANKICINTYPNPVDKNLFVVSTSGIKNNSFELLLHDMFGKLVYSKIVSPESDNYNVIIELPSSIQKGMYIISSKSEQELQFCEKKIVVQ